MQRISIPALTIIGVTLSLMAAVPQKDASAAAQLQAAINKETVEADLKAAVKQYSAIVAKYSKTDRAVAATALVHMAECHQKMGDAEARTIYEQVVRDYSDQKDAVAMARARLGGAGRSGATMTNTKVWGDPNVDNEMAISPDGRYVVFTNWDTGDLAVHEIATGVDRRLTDTKQVGKNKIKDFAEMAAISRDGKLVAYGWFNDSSRSYDLRLANLTGDPNPRRLCADPSIDWIAPFGWSPDGKQVVVKLARTDRQEQIGLVSVPDGSLHVLKSGIPRTIWSIFLSPDGRYLGYDTPRSEVAQERDVVVLSIDGATEIPAVAHRGQNLMMGWWPDGKALLFASDRSGSMDLYAIGFADGKVAGEPQMLKGDIGRAAPMGITRSGAFYYASLDGGGGNSLVELGSLDVDTGKLSHVSEPPQGILDSNGMPVWSPDGKSIAYLSQRGPRGSRYVVLVIRTVETGVMRELQPKLDSFALPVWAPDGRSFLVNGNSQGATGIYRIDAQTGEVSPAVLTQAKQSVRFPTWAPDGKSIYYQRQVGGVAQVSFFIQRDVATGGEREVISRPALGRVRLSPDGKYIATPSVDLASNSRVMLLIPAAGGEAREVMRVPVGGGNPLAQSGPQTTGVSLNVDVWAPDSRSLLVAKGFHEKNKEDEVWRVPVDGGEPRKLDVHWGTASGFVFSPDGRQVVYTITEPATPKTSDLWVLENFFPVKSAGK